MSETKNIKILAVDDEAGIRESLKLILADHYDLILTDSADQAVEILKHDPAIGLVMLDIKMPKVNGLELLDVIKQKYPDKKVIIVTGYKSVETAGEATRLGADGYIVKPFKSQKILETVGKMIHCL